MSHQHHHRPRLSRRQLVLGGAAVPLALAFGSPLGRRFLAAGSFAAGLAWPRAASLSARDEISRIVHSVDPPLEESPLWAVDGLITPTDLHFIRNHAATPTIDAATWRLVVDGAVDRAMTLSLDDLKRMPAVTRPILLECSGNSRGKFSPPATGTQWGDGAVSVAVWTGVPLAAVLRSAGVKASAVHIVCRGGDSVHVERGLPVEVALGPDTLLAYQMNGEPLPPVHGFPVRLVVPRWGGIASIKWIERLTAIDKPLEGPFQTARYIYEGPDYPTRPAYTIQPVKATVARPMPAGMVDPGPNLFSGFAWSGAAAITSVEVSIDGGDWDKARLVESGDPLVWARWEYEWDASPGQHVVLVRGTDAAGRVQPDTVPWNRQGYGYNAPYPHYVGAGEPALVPERLDVAAGAPPPAAPPAPPVAASGEDVYAQSCAACHGPNLEGTARYPALAGPGSNVPAYSRDQLLEYTKGAMPFNNPGSLTDEEYQLVTDFMRRSNGLP